MIEWVGDLKEGYYVGVLILESDLCLRKFLYGFN